MSLKHDSTKKTILILGGSYAGISTAHYILKHVTPNLSEPLSYEVVLVSASAHAMCRPACPRALISDKFFDQDKLFVDIQKQFEQYPKENFRFIQGTATVLDHTSRSVYITTPEGQSPNITFDTLIIATGASTPSPLLGFNAGDQKSLEASWSHFRTKLDAAKSIVIAGGGPAGVETAGELGEYLNGRAGFFSSKLENPKTKITVVTAATNVLPVLRPGLAKKSEAYLAKLGVTVLKENKVISISPTSSGTTIENLAVPTSITLSNGEVLNADIYIPATGAHPNTSFIDHSLLASDNRIETNPETFRVEAAGERIYAIGDCSNAFRPAVHNILAAIPILCTNIRKDLSIDTGVAKEDRKFKEDKREMQLVPIGRSMGVGAAMGWAVPSWFVWLIKGRDYWLWTTGSLWSGKQWAKES